MMKKLLAMLFAALLMMAACACADEAEPTVYTGPIPNNSTGALDCVITPPR